MNVVIHLRVILHVIESFCNQSVDLGPELDLYRVHDGGDYRPDRFCVRVLDHEKTRRVDRRYRADDCGYNREDACKSRDQ